MASAPVTRDIRRGLAAVIVAAVARRATVVFGRLGLEEVAGGGAWVQIGQTDGAISAAELVPGTTRWACDWSVTVEVHSAASHRRPADAADEAWRLACDILRGLTAQPRLGSDQITGTEPAGVRTVSEWGEEEHRHVLAVDVVVRTRGFGTGSYAAPELPRYDADLPDAPQEPGDYLLRIADDKTAAWEPAPAEEPDESDEETIEEPEAGSAPPPPGGN